VSRHNLQAELEGNLVLDSTFTGMESPEGYLMGSGTTVGNGVEGWAPGAMFVHTDGSNGTDLFYVNVGTSTTASWVNAGAPSKTVVSTADTTLTAADSGNTYISGAADLVFTLPATVAGLTYTFVADTLSSTTGLSISPNASDQLRGNGFTAADDKDAINTAATDAVGDSMTIVGNGTTGWMITNVTGTWAREA
jgi:hypothetical protein